jgi:hypothetical protein
MEFKGLTSTTLNTLVWKVWAPPKGKFFARLVMQDNISTADCVARRGWLNWVNFPLCNQVQESAAHLLYKCRFTIRIWEEILAWCGVQNISPALWLTEPFANDW